MFRLLVVLLLPLAALAQPFVWTTFTSSSNVVDAVELDGRVWMATNGGLSSFDPVSNTFDVFTNTSGLAMNQCTAVGKDSRDWVWAALSDGRISRINSHTGAARQVVDLQEDVFNITDLCDYQDEVFVSANNGIYRFFFSDLDSNFHVRERIRKLLDFPGETKVTKLVVAGSYLYAATSIGLARANLTQAYLSPDSAWENFTTSNSNLPQNGIVALGVDAGGTLWLSTASRVFSFNGASFTNITELGNIVSFLEMDGAFYAASGGQVYRLEQSAWVPFGEGLPAIVCLQKLSIGSAHELVVAVADYPSARGGLVVRENNAWSEPHNAPGIGGNYIQTLAFDPQGRLWAGGSGGTQGIFVYDNSNWKNYIRSAERPQGYLNASVEGFAFDDYGGTWVASEGDGLAWVHGDSMNYFNYTDSTGFDSNGPRLVGVAEGAWFIVTRVTRDIAGNIYVTNRRTTSNLPLVRIPAEWIARGNNRDPWNYYWQGPPATENKRDVGEVIIDPLNRKWLGANYDSPFLTWVLDDRNTPVDTTDDQWFSFAPRDYEDAAFTCFEHINGQILDWEIDQQGYLWVACPNGAFYTQAGIPQDLHALKFICVADLPFGRRVNDIHVDAQDNKWFATDAGVCVLDKNFTWIQKFRTASSADYQSDLISNSALSITSNPKTGEVWIGTPDGLSRLSTPYLSKGGDLGDLWPYPNPFRSDGTMRMFVDHKRLGGKFDELRIFTISGRLVRKLTWSQMIDPSGGWDGRNDSGDLVAGGVYLLEATSNDGKAITGKVAVLGR